MAVFLSSDALGQSNKTDCAANPGLIVPGRCIGPITATTKFSDIKNGLEGHVVRSATRADEVGIHCVTAIDPDTPQELTVHWSTETDDSVVEDFRAEQSALATCAKVDFGMGMPSSVETSSLASDIERGSASTHKYPWHTTDGLQLGMDLQEIRKVRKAGITISGYGWDYGGLTTLADNLLGQTIYRTQDWKKLTAAEQTSISGEADHPSDDPILTKLNPFLVQFIVQFPENNQPAKDSDR